MSLKDMLVPPRAPRPATFWRYLQRTPLRHLLPLIALAIAIRLAIAHLLVIYEPNLPLWLNYVLSVVPALAIALAISYLLYRRMA